MWKRPLNSATLATATHREHKYSSKCSNDQQVEGEDDSKEGRQIRWKTLHGKGIEKEREKAI